MIEIHLLYLERLTVENIENDLCQALFKVIIIGEHFPLLKMCRLKLGHLYHFKFRAMQSSPNTTLRSLAIDKWYWSELNSLLHQFSNLSRLETNLEKSYDSITNNVQPHLSMRHMRANLNDPSDDLKHLLKLTPNLSRLRIRGNLGSNEVTDHFEKMAKSLFQIVPQLQKFDCELYCAAFEQHSKELVIKQLHPLFNRVRCLFGPSYNQCYATDVSIYPVNNEYQSEYFR